MNLIPNKIYETGNYWCTWTTQMKLRPLGVEDLTEDVRDNMNEDFLFGKDGVITDYMQEIREDIYILLDDGWDVPFKTINPEMRGKFGSMEINEERFPSLNGSSLERLKAMVNRVKELGYKGLGLWIACQYPYENEFICDLEKAREYYKEKAIMCQEAGISYWKVDWGGSVEQNVEFRSVMTETVHKYAPELYIEHIPRDMGFPFNKFFYGTDNTIPEWMKKDIKRRFTISDFFRTYDVKEEFENALTLNRVALIADTGLTAGKGCKGIINVEDALYLGAVLGFSLGIMRHPKFTAGRDGHNVHCNTETIRAVRWHRFAPPYAADANKWHISQNILKDHYQFPCQEPDEWPWVSDKYLETTAPQAISRGCPLPNIKSDGESPFVVCSKNAVTGAFSVATLTRTAGEKANEMFLADVTVKEAKSDKPVGIFGRYKSLSIIFDTDLINKKVYIQDLADNTAYDCTELVNIRGNELYITGEIIDKFGLTYQSENDLSQPGLVLMLK